MHLFFLLLKPYVLCGDYISGVTQSGRLGGAMAAGRRMTSVKAGRVRVVHKFFEATTPARSRIRPRVKNFAKTVPILQKFHA